MYISSGGVYLREVMVLSRVFCDYSLGLVLRNVHIVLCNGIQHIYSLHNASKHACTHVLNSIVVRERVRSICHDP